MATYQELGVAVVPLGVEVVEVAQGVGQQELRRSSDPTSC